MFELPTYTAPPLQQEPSTGTTVVKPSETQASYKPIHQAIRLEMKKMQGKDGRIIDVLLRASSIASGNTSAGHVMDRRMIIN